MATDGTKIQGNASRHKAMSYGYMQKAVERVREDIEARAHPRAVRKFRLGNEVGMTRNPLTQLATLGEEVLEKASQNPRTARLVQGAAQAKDRIDDLTKRVRGLEAMEKRIAELETRVKKLETKKPAARKAAQSPPPTPPPKD